MLHRHASARTLGVVRISVFGLWLAELVREPIRELAEVPPEFFQPIGVLRWLPDGIWPHVLTADFLWSFKLTLTALLVLLVVGIGPYRALAVTVCLLLTFWQGLHRGLVSMAHRELALLYVTYAIAWFPATDAFALRRATARAMPVLYRAPLVFAALVFCLTYTAVGLRRVVYAGPEIFVDGTILRYVVVRSAEPGFWSYGSGWLVLDHWWLGLLLQLTFPVVTVFEILAPLCLFFARFRWVWLAVILMFHLGSWSLMQIWFLHNVLLLPILMVEWEPWRGTQRANRRSSKPEDWNSEWERAWKPTATNPWFEYQAEVYRDWMQRPPCNQAGKLLKTDAFDEACGFRPLDRFADASVQKVLMDVSPRILAQARRYNETHTVQCVTDVRQLAFRAGAFDLIFSPSTLDHFDDPRDIEMALRELRQTLRHGGRLVITLDNPSNPILRARQVLHRFSGPIGGLIPFYMGRTLSRAALVRTLEGAGFAVHDSGYMVHAPRLLGLWLGEWAARRGAHRRVRQLRRLFCAVDLVAAALPTRRWTGHFVVADCTRSERPP